MAALTSTPAPVQHIQHARFTSIQHGYGLLYLSLNSSGNIAVSGYHSNGRTFIDLYLRWNLVSRGKFNLFYSKEFERYSTYWARYVSFLDTNGTELLVTCIGDKIEIIDTKNESKVLRSCRVDGSTTCLAVSEGKVFIGLYGLQTVIMFNKDLNEMNKFMLNEIQYGDWPWDLQVIKDTIFVSTVNNGRALSVGVDDKGNITHHTYNTRNYKRALSITASERLGLVAVLWCNYTARKITVYSLNEKKSSLVFDVDDNVSRIRISDRDRMITTENKKTGEIKMYDLKHGKKLDLQGELVFVTEQFEEQKKTFRASRTESTKEIERLTERLKETNQSLELSRTESTRKIATLTHEIARIKAESIKDIGTLTEEVKLTKQLLDLSRIESNKNMATLTEELEHTRIRYTKEKEELTQVGRESTEKIERLTKELKQTKQCETESVRQIETMTEEQTQMRRESTEKIERLTEELAQTRKKSTKEIETLAEELKQTKQCKTESVRQIEAMAEELTQMRRESTEKIERLTEELEQIQKKSTKEIEEHTQMRRESTKMIERLTEELEQTQKKSTKEIEEHTQLRRESTEQIERLTEELEHTQKKSTKEIEEHTQMRRESTKKIERLTEELQQTKQSKAETTQQIEALTVELNETKEKLVTRIKELGTAKKDLEVTKQVLQETKQDRDITRTELKHYQLDFAKESKALKEVMNQTKEAMSELQKRAVQDKPIAASDQAKDDGVSIRAAEFGRLTVAIAEHLTLDHCLKLARFCNIPASDCDTVLRVSLIESPGMKLLDVLKKRKVINMFDVTNLQKGLAMLHMVAVNHDLVRPYQEGIDKEQYELYKAEALYTWQEVDVHINAVKEDTARRQVRESQTSLEDDAKPTSQIKATAQQSETGEEGRRSLLSGRHHHLYIEHSIGREGGTIQLANVSLTVPPDALHESHVVALSVMNESPFSLDREVDTARMTPLIKLEPLGLMFNKSLLLNIPHSALIPEPENHDVIIYLGQISKNIEDSSDSITWTEERSIPRQLKEKSVTVDIQCLSYLSASLVSKTTAPPLYIVRAVPFVDGVRNTEDNITLTICFCSDNDSEYNTLLRDYQTKLRLEQYSTLQLRRHSERDEDDARFLSVTVTSVNNTYVPDAEQAVKKFPVSHLCTASRVSHQLILNKNQDTDRDVVDIMLTFSQAQYGPTKVSLKARIKDLIISEESEKLLTGSLPPANKIYEDMVANISSSLDTEHCRELSTYFQLTLEDTEIITSNQDPGKKLMKTLEERSVIDSQKMILFFGGLKACHLDEIAKLVSEYTSEISKQTQEKEQKPEEDKKTEETEEGTPVSKHLLKKGQLNRTAHSSLSDQSVQTTLSSSCVSSDAHVKALTKEGYTEHEVVEALDISRNRLVMARKVLQCIGEQLDVPPTKEYIFLHKEQYIDENGGELTLREANVHLLIPVGAVSKGSIVSLTMMTSKQVNVPFEGRTPQLSPAIKLGQEGLTLNKPVTIRIPHCASETEGITSTDIYLGFSSNGEEIQWRKRKQHEAKSTLEEDHFEVLLQTFCAISMNIAVDFRKPMSKRFRVLPLISRIVNPTDDLTVTLWIYNDDETEHMHLLQEQINVHGKIQLHDFKKFTLKGSEKDKEVYIKSGNNKITSHANTNMKKVLSATLWHNTRHAVEFHFQNKEGIRDVSFRLQLCQRRLVIYVTDLQFDFKIALSELLQKPQGSIRALLGTQEPQPAMEKSFQELVSKLSGQLDVDTCLEIAGIFRLSADLRDKVKKSSEPGKVIFDELIHEQLITAASVSALDVALTRTGYVHLAEDVKEYRMKNVTFPTTLFTLL